MVNDFETWRQKIILWNEIKISGHSVQTLDHLVIELSIDS